MNLLLSYYCSWRFLLQILVVFFWYLLLNQFFYIQECWCYSYGILIVAQQTYIICICRYLNWAIYVQPSLIPVVFTRSVFQRKIKKQPGWNMHLTCRVRISSNCVTRTRKQQPVYWSHTAGMACHVTSLATKCLRHLLDIPALNLSHITSCPGRFLWFFSVPTGLKCCGGSLCSYSPFMYHLVLYNILIWIIMSK